MRSIDPDTRSLRARLRARLAHASAAGRARVRDERGSMLIEVMVGAVVLSITTVALLNGLDGAQGTGAQNKARTVAAALAEQDQERMRALPVLTLVGTIGTPTSRPVVVRGVTYTVKSTATWAPDNGGVLSCSNNTRTASNVRIVSEVSSAATRGVVDVASLVTPPAGTAAAGLGRAIVKITNKDDAIYPNVTVQLSGPGTYTGTTNSLGCAIFSFIPEGNYTAAVQNAGLVDPNGVAPSEDFTVPDGGSQPVPIKADSAAEIRAQFDTKVATATAVAAKSQFITILNSGLTVGQKTFEAIPAGAPGTQINATSLFPFSDGYSVYAGRCPTNNPSVAPTNNALALQKFTPTPGQILTTSPKIRVPSINVRVLRSDGVAVTTAPFATVFVKTNDAGCTNVFPSQISNTSSRLPEPGFPYGNYKICAQRTAGTPAVTMHGHADVRGTGYITGTTHVDDNVPNTNPAGNSTTTTDPTAIQIKMNQSGACH